LNHAGHLQNIGRRKLVQISIREWHGSIFRAVRPNDYQDHLGNHPHLGTQPRWWTQRPFASGMCCRWLSIED